MNFCQNCGSELKENSAFCSVCGAPVAQQNPEEAGSYSGVSSYNSYSVGKPRERNIGLAILFSILTCGIYGIYWLIKLNNETNEAAGKTDYTSGIVVFLLTIVTCGIYGIYWYYKIAEVQDEALAAHGLATKNNSVLYLVLGLLGLGIVNYILLQSSLNDISRT